MNSILTTFKNTTIVKIIDNVLSKIGFIGSMERTHIDTFTENRIKNIKGKLIAESNYGKIWFEQQELGGFLVLNTTIVSGSNIKSDYDCTLIFKSLDDFKLTLQSDEKEVESNFSNVSNRWITQICYHLSKEDLLFINNSSYDSLQLDFKDKSMPFLVL